MIIFKYLFVLNEDDIVPHVKWNGPLRQPAVPASAKLSLLLTCSAIHRECVELAFPNTVFHLYSGETTAPTPKNLDMAEGRMCMVKARKKLMFDLKQVAPSLVQTIHYLTITGDAFNKFFFSCMVNIRSIDGESTGDSMLMPELPNLTHLTVEWGHSQPRWLMLDLLTPFPNLQKLIIADPIGICEGDECVAQCGQISQSHSWETCRERGLRFCFSGCDVSMAVHNQSFDAIRSDGNERKTALDVKMSNSVGIKFFPKYYRLGKPSPQFKLGTFSEGMFLHHYTPFGMGNVACLGLKKTSNEFDDVALQKVRHVHLLYGAGFDLKLKALSTWQNQCPPTMAIQEESA